MILFKTFLKICNKCKTPIIMYSVLLIFFGGFHVATNDSSLFTEEKPDILLVNEDTEEGLTKVFIQYLKENSHVKDIEKTSVDDALFYRDVNVVVYIPSAFRKDFLAHKKPQIEIKSTKDYQASLEEMMIERFMKVANLYLESQMTEEEIIKHVNKSLDYFLDVDITSNVDTKTLEKASSFYNFTNYCFLAGGIYVICLILSSFTKESIHKRTIISSTSDKKINRYLLYSNFLFTCILWLFYCVLSVILIGKGMFSWHGFYFILNAFLFAFCALTIASLLGNLSISKEAINGIVNVIALGSSFLCGAFVPMSFLPPSVIRIAHIFPSYYFIKNNELIKEIETFSWESLQPIIINMGIILLFAGLFIVCTNVISIKKRKIA